MQYSQERGKHDQLKSRLSRATKPKSHPASNTICPSSKLAHTTYNTNFPHQQPKSHHKTNTFCPVTQNPTSTSAEAAGGPGCDARGRRQGLAGQRADAPSEARGADGEWAGRSASITTTPPVWRAPEGLEGQGGLRGAAPNEVRSPSLAGGRALRRPEHQRHHKRLRLACNALAARLAQGQAAVAVDGRTHVDEAWARQERRVGAGAELADGV